MQYQNKNLNEKGRHKIIKIISLCLKNYNLKYYYNGRCFFFHIPMGHGVASDNFPVSKQSTAINIF